MRETCMLQTFVECDDEVVPTNDDDEHVITLRKHGHWKTFEDPLLWDFAVRLLAVDKLLYCGARYNIYVHRMSGGRVEYIRLLRIFC